MGASAVLGLEGSRGPHERASEAVVSFSSNEGRGWMWPAAALEANSDGDGKGPRRSSVGVAGMGCRRPDLAGSEHGRLVAAAVELLASWRERER